MVNTVRVAYSPPTHQNPPQHLRLRHTSIVALSETTMARSPIPSPSPAHGRPQLGELLGISSLRRAARSPAPSSRNVVPPLASSSTAVSDPVPGNTGPDLSRSMPSIIELADASAPPVDAQDAPTEDPMITVWNQAVDEFRRKMGVDFLGPNAEQLTSKVAIVDYIGTMEKTEENETKKSRWKKLRDRFIPLARVFEKLCGPIGDTLSATVFPPGKIVFAVIGLIVNMAIKSHEEFEQISDAFGEIHNHLQVVQVVLTQPESLIHEASVKLLIQILTVLGEILKLRKENYASSLTQLPAIERLIKSLVDMRPLSDALKDLKKLTTHHHEAIAAVTYDTVTRIMSNISSGKYVRQCLFIGSDPLSEGKDEISRLHPRIIDIARNIQGKFEQSRLTTKRLTFAFYLRRRQCQELGYLEEHGAEMERIRAWLGHPDSSPRMSRLLNDRAPCTNLWFLESETFADLKEGRKRALLLHGQAGCGKSTMIAAAVRDLQAYCLSRGPNYLVLTHFFDATDNSRLRDLPSLLSSFLCQLALNNQHCMGDLAGTRAKSVATGCFTNEDMIASLRTLLAKDLRVFLVIDALDESLDRNIIPALEDLRLLSCVSMLLSARLPFGKEKLHDSCVAIDQDNANTDIHTILDMAFSRGGPLATISDAFDVKRKLMRGAEGKCVDDNLYSCWYNALTIHQACVGRP
ncbi:hypothetical protein EV715DRAFT_209739 [Schizophyllum commune]